MREWKEALCVSSAALATSVAGPAAAQERVLSIDVPAGTLETMLAALATQTKTSFALDAPLPQRRAIALRGRMTVDAAYARLLAGTGLSAHRVGPATFRISAAPAAPNAGPTAASADPTVSSDIIVTARKMRELLSQVPGPVTVHVLDGSAAAGSDAGTSAVATQVQGLIATNGGPGASRLFLRGIADSPFIGFGQSPVSVYLNEARITYDAPDPDFRMVDVDRVEVLKGPQGPLYGTGALGGVYRVMTIAPDLGQFAGRSRQRIAGLPGHGVGASVEGVVNLPVRQDQAALRLVGYVDVAPGWIDNAGGRSDVNQTVVRGARASLRVLPREGWTFDFVGAGQSIRARDSQYVDRDREELTRGDRLREPRSNDVVLTSGVLQGELGSRVLTVSTSLATQWTLKVDDASSAAAVLGLVAPLRYAETRTYQVFDQEIRLANKSGRTPWALGVSYLSSRSSARGRASEAGPVVAELLDASRSVTETAMFAEGSRPLIDGLRLGLGLRVFRSTVKEDRDDDGGTEVRAKTSWGVSPSATLSWSPSSVSLAYLRVASAFRPGGLDPSNMETRRYDADQLVAFEAGFRQNSINGRLQFELGAFSSLWSDVQSDYLLDTGLVATRNAGDARILGGELTVRWRPTAAWSFVAGASGQRARLIRGIDGADLERDPRLPVVPGVSGHFEVRHSINASSWQVSPTVTGRYVGRSRLSLDPGLDRRMGGFAEFAAGLEVRRGPFAVELSATNIFNARGDTLAFGNPFSVRTERQYTPARPRAFAISLSRDF